LLIKNKVFVSEGIKYIQTSLDRQEEKEMQEVYEFLKKCGTYYLATVEGDQPRVRPFGTVDILKANFISNRQSKRCVKTDSGKSKSGALCLCRRQVAESVRQLVRDDRVEAKSICLIIIRSLKVCILRRTTIRKFFTLKMRQLLLLIYRGAKVIKF